VNQVIETKELNLGSCLKTLGLLILVLVTLKMVNGILITGDQPIVDKLDMCALDLASYTTHFQHLRLYMKNVGSILID